MIRTGLSRHSFDLATARELTKYASQAPFIHCCVHFSTKTSDYRNLTLSKKNCFELSFEIDSSLL